MCVETRSDLPAPGVVGYDIGYRLSHLAPHRIKAPPLQRHALPHRPNETNSRSRLFVRTDVASGMERKSSGWKYWTGALPVTVSLWEMEMRVAEYHTNSKRIQVIHHRGRSFSYLSFVESLSLARSLALCVSDKTSQRCLSGDTVRRGECLVTFSRCDWPLFWTTNKHGFYQKKKKETTRKQKQ